MIKLSKLLFPKAQTHERRRHMRTLCLAIIVGIVFAAVVTGFILLAYHSERFSR
jgi:hypothetical protein